MSDKKGFLIYLTYKEQFDLLSDEELGILIRSIMEYEINRIEPTDLKGMSKMAFSFIKSNLDRDRQKYEEKCKKNKENGSRGGRPRKNQTDTEEDEKTERFSRKPNGY